MRKHEIPTRVALAGWEEHRFFGHAVFEELTSNVSITELCSLAVTGRLPNEETQAVLDDLAAVATLADPRFWPLKVARVAASFGSSMLGSLLGQLSQDRALIGGSVPGRAATWLERYVSERAKGRPVEEVLEELMEADGRLDGFGLPLRRVDERTECLKKRLRALGRDRLPHWQGFLEVAEALREKPKMAPNQGGASAAALLDCGYSPEEINDLMYLLLQPSFIANAVEGSAHRSPFLRRLPREHVVYEGAPPRVSPRSLFAREGGGTSSKSEREPNCPE